MPLAVLLNAATAELYGFSSSSQRGLVWDLLWPFVVDCELGNRSTVASEGIPQSLRMSSDACLHHKQLPSLGTLMITS